MAHGLQRAVEPVDDLLDLGIRIAGWAVEHHPEEVADVDDLYVEHERRRDEHVHIHVQAGGVETGDGQLGGQAQVRVVLEEELVLDAVDLALP